MGRKGSGVGHGQTPAPKGCMKTSLGMARPCAWSVEVPGRTLEEKENTPRPRLTAFGAFVSTCSASLKAPLSRCTARSRSSLSPAMVERLFGFSGGSRSGTAKNDRVDRSGQASRSEGRRPPPDVRAFLSWSNRLHYDFLTLMVTSPSLIASQNSRFRGQVWSRNGLFKMLSLIPS